MSTTVEVRELTLRWPEVLDTVRRGEDVVVVDQSVPQARIAPFLRRQAGLHPGALMPTPDFDEPVPESVWMAQP